MKIYLSDMMFKVVRIKEGKRQQFEMTAVEILEEYGTEIRICDLHKKKAPIVVSSSSDEVVKIYGYEGIEED
jgi:hypothetical protein